MLVAIPVENETMSQPVCPSFGRAPFFLLYDMDNDKKSFIPNPAASSQGGAGIKAAQALVDSKADALLTPRCGENAAKVLQAADIDLYKTGDGTVEEQIILFNDKKLARLTEIHAGFHKHG